MSAAAATLGLVAPDVTTAAVDISTRGAGLGLIGGIIVTAVAVSAILLLRNMNARIRRLPESFDDEPARDGSGPASGPDEQGPISPR